MEAATRAQRSAPFEQDQTASVDALELRRSPETGYPQVVEAFSEVAERIGEVADLDELLHLVATKICSLLSVGRCSVYLKDEESGLFRGQVAETGSDVDDLIKRLTAGSEADGFTREILAARKPVLISNAQSDPRPVRATMRRWGVRAMLGVPMVLKQEVIGLLFVDDADSPRQYSHADQQVAAAFANLAAIAISQAQLTSELRSSLKTVARQNGVLRRAEALDERLTKLMLDGADLERIAAAVAELTGKPCAVYDSGYRRLAAATSPQNDSQLVPALFEPTHREHPEVQQALAGLKENQPGVVGPLRSAGLQHRFLIAPVAVRGENWGQLVLMESPDAFGPLDLAVARRTATVIALEFSTQERLSEAELHARGGLVRDLVRGTDNRESLSRRAGFHGLRPTHPHVVALFRRRDPSSTRPTGARRVAEALEASGEHERGVYVSHVQDGAAAILELPEGEPGRAAVEWAREVVRRTALAIAPDGDAIVSVSSPTTGIAGFEAAYREALDVARCATLFGMPEGEPYVLTAGDLGPARIFMSASNPEELERFADSVLGPLLDGGDDDPEPELLETLEAFFASSRRVRGAADALDVHENTIRYRLAKIEETLGLAVTSDSDDQLACQLALEVVKLRRRSAA